MLRKFKSIRKTIALGVVALPVILFAAPEISVDNANFDAGVISEGSMKELRHTFIIKNIGDEILKIEKVRPG